jgi:hypothetical protein
VHVRVDVGFTTVRPVIPDQYLSRVHLEVENEADAELLALQLVASRPGVEMVTSSVVLV